MTDGPPRPYDGPKPAHDTVPNQGTRIPPAQQRTVLRFGAMGAPRRLFMI